MVKAKIVIEGTFKGKLSVIVPEGFFSLDADAQVKWAQNYIKEQKAAKLMEELKLNHMEAMKVLDVLDIFDRSTLSYIERDKSVDDAVGNDGPGI